MPGVFVSLTDAAVLDFVLEKSGLKECEFVNKYLNRKIERQKDRKTERQKDRKTERQKDRKTERQKDSKTIIMFVRLLHMYLSFFLEKSDLK